MADLTTWRCRACGYTVTGLIEAASHACPSNRSHMTNFELVDDGTDAPES